MQYDFLNFTEILSLTEIEEVKLETILNSKFR